MHPRCAVGDGLAAEQDRPAVAQRPETPQARLALAARGDESEDDIRPDFMDEIVKTAAMIEAGALDQMDSATSESSSDR